MKRFVVDAVADLLSDDSEDILSSDSDEPVMELINERAGVPARPQRVNEQEEPLNLRCKMRQNRRQPKRYGVSVLDY